MSIILVLNYKHCSIIWGILLYIFFNIDYLEWRLKYMKIITYLVLLIVFSTTLFILSSSVLHTNIPLTDFLLSILVTHLVIDKIEKYYNEFKE